MKLLVVGLGVTGLAVARHARARGWALVVVEDEPGVGFDERRHEVEELGGVVITAPDEDQLRELVGGVDLVVPSPGVPVRHPVFTITEAAGVRLVSEVELAAPAATAPIVAITGTNGKTTVTTLVTEMARASGLRAIAAGNIGRPLVEVVEEPADVVVAEVSSFQLEHTRTFRPRVAVVLNLADDHLDWHPSFDHYRAAKARIFANQRDEDVLVLNADDAAVASMASDAAASVEYFGLEEHPGAWCLVGTTLVTPDRRVILRRDELPRSRPHDVANALAAAAAAHAAGCDLDGVRSALRRFEGLPHRLTLVGEAGGVVYYDDSKATNPHATVAAVRGFDSVVLLAGGRNKGVPLAPLRSVADHLRAVVAFGEAGDEVSAVFSETRPVTRVDTLREAVEAAANLARPGDVVLLSPACASFDAYVDYGERGRDFERQVALVLGAADG